MNLKEFEDRLTDELVSEGATNEPTMVRLVRKYQKRINDLTPEELRMFKLLLDTSYPGWEEIELTKPDETSTFQEIPPQIPDQGNEKPARIEDRFRQMPGNKLVERILELRRQESPDLQLAERVAYERGIKIPEGVE